MFELLGNPLLALALVLPRVIGAFLMLTRLVLGTSGAMANSDHLVGALTITVAIIVALFLVQSKGVAFIGRMFGPVMLVWFCVLVLLGLGGLHVGGCAIDHGGADAFVRGDRE